MKGAAARRSTDWWPNGLPRNHLRAWSRRCGSSATEPTASLAPSAIAARRGQAEPGDDRGNHTQPGDDKGGNKGGKRNDDPANHH